jgi:putative PIG3 family NAD(P)H quinone oxidoreductase
MRAVVVDEPGGPEHLHLAERPRPLPGPDELLVRVRATALNRADLMQREGRYPPPEGVTDILGLEMAGTVEAQGSACVGWNQGDRVCALLPGGGYAEYVTVPHEMAIPLPPRLSFEEAAAIPEVFLTAFQALHWHAGVESAHDVLIHAGASGVGTAAIQVARHAGARVFVTASAPKHERCLDLGAAAAIDYRNEDFAERIDALTDGRGVDVILDFIGAPYFERNIQSLAQDGDLVLLSLLGGHQMEEVSLSPLFRKRARITASTLRSRTPQYKVKLTRDFASRLLPLFEDGTLQPVIDSTFDWTDVGEAHRRMGNNENAGKIILRINGEG